MKQISVCHTINPNSKTSALFKHPLPYYVITMTGVGWSRDSFVARCEATGVWKWRWYCLSWSRDFHVFALPKWRMWVRALLTTSPHLQKTTQVFLLRSATHLDIGRGTGIRSSDTLSRLRRGTSPTTRLGRQSRDCQYRGGWSAIARSETGG